MKKAVYLGFLIFSSFFCTYAQNTENDTNRNNPAHNSEKADRFSKKEIILQGSAKDSLSFMRDVIIEHDVNLIPQHMKQPKPKPEFTGLIINQDERIELLCEQYMNEKEIKGYKIQIFSGHSRWEASKTKTDFISEYPYLPVPKLIYQSPNFKLRMGDYRNRFEAEKILRSLNKEFSSAFIVKDKVNIEVDN